MPLPFSALLGAYKVCGTSPVQTIPKLFEFVSDLQLDDLAVKHVHLFGDAEDCRGTLSTIFLKTHPVRRMLFTCTKGSDDRFPADYKFHIFATSL